MKDFNFRTELQRIADTKQLVQVYFQDEPNKFTVGYLLNVQSDYITLVEVSDLAVLDGITIYPASSITKIKAETLYLSELIKHIPSNSVYQRAKEQISPVKEFTFEGFITGFENSDTVVEINEKGDNSLVGRIVAHDDSTVVLDEYQDETDRRFARCYIPISGIERIAVDIPYMRILARSLADKNL